MKKLTNMQQLALDLYNRDIVPCEEFSNTREAEDRLRDMLNEKIAECKDYYGLQENKHAIFRIVSELIEIPVERMLRESLDPFAEYKNVEYNELAEFEIDDDRLYDVSVIARDNNNLQRQRITGKKLRLDAFDLGVKVYDHFARFLAGEVDFAKMIDKVERSLEEEITKRIGQAFVAAYDVADDDLKVTGTVDKDKLLELCEKIGRNSVIYGSRVALNKVPGLEAYDPDNTDKRNNGYVKLFNGHKCVEIENVYDKDSKTWGFANDKLYIIADGIKPVKVAKEGNPLVIEDTTGNKFDASIEFILKQRVQIGVVKAVKTGVYVIQ